MTIQLATADQSMPNMGFKAAAILGMNRSKLIRSIENGDEAAARELLALPDDLLEDRGASLALLACELDFPGCLRALIDNGALPEQGRIVWLHDAIWRCHAKDAPGSLLALLADPTLPKLFDLEGLHALFQGMAKSPRCVASLEAALIGRAAPAASCAHSPALRM